MKTIRIVALVALVMGTVTIGAAQATEHPRKTEHPTGSEHPTKSEHPARANDVVVVAKNAGDLMSFIAAVEAAGLLEKLQGQGPFTIFAPTDEAFAQLAEGDVEELLAPANRAKLAGILAYHVVPGKIMSADLKTMKATNVSGQDLAIEVEGGVVTVDGATVVKADLDATNGVIHTIDRVLEPTAAAERPARDQPKDHPAH